MLLHSLLLDHPGVSLHRKQATVQIKMKASNGGNLLSRHLKTTPLADTLYLNSHLVHRVNLAIYTGLPLSSQIPIISTRHPVNLQGRATSIQRHKRLSALNKRLSALNKHLSALSHRH